MQLIAGLGNPGPEYAANRHNVGFMAINAIAERHGFPPFRNKFRGLLSEGRIGTARVLLFKPQTFMNRSGDAIGQVCRFYKLDPADVTIVYDEIDLVPGKVRIKTGGGNGGHNGLRSIDPVIGTGYVRVRFGVGHPGHKDLVARYVLNDFAKSDRDWLDPLLGALADNAGLLCAGDDSGLMNKLALATNPKSADDTAAKPARQKARNAEKPVDRTPAPDDENVPAGPMAEMLKRLFGKAR